MNFADMRLNGFGELAVSRYFKDPILVCLGERTLLSVTRIENPLAEQGDDDSAKNLYVVRNLREDGRGGEVAFDDSRGARNEADTVVTKTARLQVLRRASLRIGTAEDTARQLGPLDGVRPFHMNIRVGNLAGHLHFSEAAADMATIAEESRAVAGGSGGTVVYVGPQEARHLELSLVRRERVGCNTPNPQTLETVNQRWSRGDAA